MPRKRRSLDSEGTEGIAHVSTSMNHFMEQTSKNIGPQAFQDLLQRPTVLLEVACAPNSILSETVRRQAGYEGAAIRCSHWNGGDLSTASGVKHILDQIVQFNPQHVWISPICGPYSPLQAINQRTEQQQKDLEEKRQNALKQYVGAASIFYFCHQRGTHVSWEWSQRCQAWRLPLMQNMYKRLVPFFAVVHGCRVNMRCTNAQTLMSKAWKVMSTHKKMAENLNLPCHCPKGYQHGRCEGGQAGRTAYYTQEFANKVSQALLIEHTHETLQAELQGQATCPPGFNEGHHCVCEQIKKHDARIPCGTCQTGAQTTARVSQVRRAMVNCRKRL